MYTGPNLASWPQESMLSSPRGRALTLVLFSFSLGMRTRGDMLWFAIAFALMRARKLVRGLLHGLSEDERYLIAEDVVRCSATIKNWSARQSNRNPVWRQHTAR